MHRLHLLAAMCSLALVNGCSAQSESSTSISQITEVASSTFATSERFQSPDGQIQVLFALNDKGLPNYSVQYRGENIIEPSALGFIFEGMGPLTKGFKLIDKSSRSFDNTWQTVWGERSEIRNHYNELTFGLQEAKGLKRKVNIIFRVFDDGVAFSYEIPQQRNVEDIRITDELTQFKLAGNHLSWWIENHWDSYERTYQTTSLAEVKEVSTPFTMRTNKGTHISIHEAKLVDYSGMALRKIGGNSFISALAPWANSNIKVKGMNGKRTSVTTPWRTIQIAPSAGELAESNLILNLNDPNKLEDTSWIEPMKYMGIWWEMHVGVSDWGRHNNNHGATTHNTKRYIDFIHKYLIDGTENEKVGLLVEGWNVGWDGEWWKNFDKFGFTEQYEYPDYDLSEVVAYGKDRGVEIIAHNETSGGIENYDNQLIAAYKDYQRLGIHAIKSGYVANSGMMQPKGEHHHGQYMVNHYNNAVIQAADYQIMINTHEPIKDTGLRRTYPNWVSREGAKGQEYNAWSEGNPPEHTTILPFTRLLSGPMDYTPGIFDVEIEQNDRRVHSTRAKQLALMVAMYSPVQMITDLPQNYMDENGEIFPEFKFMVDVPVEWDETVYLDSQVGDYVTLARKEKGQDEWYLAAYTDENPRELKIPLGFLGEGKYVAEIYADGADADYDTNPESVSISKKVVDAGTTLTASLIKSGGMAVRFYKAP